MEIVGRFILVLEGIRVREKGRVLVLRGYGSESLGIGGVLGTPSSIYI